MNGLIGRAAALLLIIIILSLWSWQGLRNRELDLRNAEILVNWLASAAEFQVDGTMRTIDALLSEAADRIVPLNWPDPALEKWFAVRLMGVPEIRNIAIADAEYRIVGGSFDSSNRVFPGKSQLLSYENIVRQTQEEPPSGRLIIGTPFISPLTGEPSIPVAKAIIDGRGQVLGWVVAAVKPDVFRDQLSAVVIEEQGGAALFGNGAVFLARVPNHEQFLGQSFASNPLTEDVLAAQPKGVRHFISPADGNDKVVAYRKLDRFPLFLTVGLTTNTALERWRNQLATEGAVLLVLFTAMIWLALRYDRRAAANRALVQQIKAAKDMAETLLQERSRFFSAASHDLRQPVYTLRLLTNATSDLIHDSNISDPELADLVAETEASVIDLSEFLDHLLDVSRLEAGNVAASVIECPLQPILGQLAQQFLRIADHANVRLEVVRNSCWVRTDPDLCLRALSNLLVNAIKFSEGGRVLVGCRRRGPDVEVMVCDTGIGIPQAELEAIFEDFRQLGNAARQREKGFGLGLGIVRRIMILLGHSLNVRSTVGKGTVFSVTMPRVDSKDHAVLPSTGT